LQVGLSLLASPNLNQTRFSTFAQRYYFNATRFSLERNVGFWLWQSAVPHTRTSNGFGGCLIRYLVDPLVLAIFAGVVAELVSALLMILTAIHPTLANWISLFRQTDGASFT
jgi:hypothetical protein